MSFLRLFLSLFRFRACPTGQNAMVNVLHFSTFHTDGPQHISSSMMFNVKICYTNLYHVCQICQKMPKEKACRRARPVNAPSSSSEVALEPWQRPATSQSSDIVRPSAKQTPAPRWTPPHWCLTPELGLRRKNSQSITKYH